MVELKKSNDLEFYDVMNKQMKSWQDVVDAFKHLAMLFLHLWLLCP
jgi:hypothetical protein